MIQIKELRILDRKKWGEAYGDLLLGELEVFLSSSIGCAVLCYIEKAEIQWSFRILFLLVVELWLGHGDEMTTNTSVHFYVWPSF